MRGNELIVKGCVSSNFGSARKFIGLQKVHFNDLPHRDELYDGTINLNISPQRFEIIKSEYRYENIKWGESTEDFELVEVLRLGKTESGMRHIKGYLYFPSRSPNMRGGEILEIWTTKIDGIAQGNSLVIEVPDGYLEIM